MSDMKYDVEPLVVAWGAGVACQNGTLFFRVLQGTIRLIAVITDRAMLALPEHVPWAANLHEDRHVL